MCLIQGNARCPSPVSAYCHRLCNFVARVFQDQCLLFDNQTFPLPASVHPSVRSILRLFIALQCMETRPHTKKLIWQTFFPFKFRKTYLSLFKELVLRLPLRLHDNPFSNERNLGTFFISTFPLFAFPLYFP